MYGMEEAHHLTSRQDVMPSYEYANMRISLKIGEETFGNINTTSVQCVSSVINIYI